jgi:spermidine/putrescine transport system permease protein
MNTKNVYPKIIISWLFIFSFLPAIMLFVLSFMTPDIKAIAKFPLTLSHYQTLIEPLFLKIAWRSFYLAGFATLICLIIS